MINYAIHNIEKVFTATIELAQDKLKLNPNYVGFIEGQIGVRPGYSGIINAGKRRFLGTNFLTPLFEGTGKIYLRSTIGVYSVLKLEQEEFIIKDTTYVAHETTLTPSPSIQMSVGKLFSSTSIISTKLTGSGNIIVVSIGELASIELNNSKFIAAHAGVIGHSASIKHTKEMFHGGILGMRGLSKKLDVYRGSGKLIVAKHAKVRCLEYKSKQG